MKSSTKEIVVLGITLGLVSMIAALGLSITYSVTKPVIAMQAKKALENAQKEIFPDALEFVRQEDMIGKTNGSTIIKDFYIANSSENTRIGYLVSATTPGYGGIIYFIIGVTMDGRLKSVKVSEHTETPGLGANITSKGFLGQFVNKKLSDEFVVKKDVKAITAATISSKAITKGIKALIDLSQNSEAGDTK